MREMGSEGNKTQTFEDLSGYMDKSAFNHFFIICLFTYSTILPFNKLK